MLVILLISRIKTNSNYQRKNQVVSKGKKSKSGFRSHTRSQKKNEPTNLEGKMLSPGVYSFICWLLPCMKVREKNIFLMKQVRKKYSKTYVRKFKGTWVAQSVKYLSLAQVTIPGSWDQILHQAPCIRLLISGESASPSPSAPLPHALSLSLSHSFSNK